MRAKLLPCVLALAGLVLSNCQKTDVAPGTDRFSDASGRIAATAATTNCDRISFTNASGLVSGVTSDNGLAVGITSNNPGYSQPIETIIFNSTLPHPEDYDLGTPNQAFGGPGKVDVGSPEPGGQSNTQSLGNIIVLQEFIPYGVTPNDDDVVNGFIQFNFPQPVTANSLTVIDVEISEQEGGTVQLYNGNALISTVTIPVTGSNGVAAFSLGGAQNVTSVKINFSGSMGFDNLTFCTTPPGGGCTLTQGYWKNHAEAWPVSSLTLGTVTYSQAELLQILNKPVAGNGLVSLARQLIAAKLNVANGADPSAIAATITAADLLIGSKNVLTGGYIHPSQTSALNDKLDQYNRGVIGPGHCK